jgi:hypothetical protein
MHRGAAEARSTESESFDELLQFGWQTTVSPVPMWLPHQACQTMASVCVHPALQSPKLELMLARQLCQRHAVFQTRAD